MTTTQKHGTGSARPAAGFTLVELIVVMAIIITLMATSLVIYSSIGSDEVTQATTDIRLLMQALDLYASASGGVHPPNVTATAVIITPDVNTPSGSGPDVSREKESSAALYYFLTRTIYFSQSANPQEVDPQMVGKPKLGGRGPYLDTGSLPDRTFADLTMREDRDIVVNLPDPGYTGKTTWLKDPWGTPYRYIVKDNGRRYVIESAGPDKLFGSSLRNIESGNEQEDEDEARDNIRSDQLSRW